MISFTAIQISDIKFQSSHLHNSDQTICANDTGPNSVYTVFNAHVIVLLISFTYMQEVGSFYFHV